MSVFCENSTVLSAVVAPRWAQCLIRCAEELEGTVARIAGREGNKNRNKPVDVMRMVIERTMCRVLIMRANSFVPAISQSSQIDYAIISCFCDGSCAAFFYACALPSCGLCVSFR